MGCGASTLPVLPPDSPSKYVQKDAPKPSEPVLESDAPAPDDAAEEEEDDDAMEAAAQRIQAMQRGNSARRDLAEQHEAATKMQAIQRGRASRRKEPEPEPEPELEPEPEPEPAAQPLGEFPDDECPAEMPDLANHHTLMAEVLRNRPELYEQYRTVRSSSGVPFARCIKTGMDNRGSRVMRNVGLVAGDPDCYHSFVDLFHPVIEARHGWRAEEQKHYNDLETARVLDRPLFRAEPSPAERNRYIKTVRLRSARSITGFRFPPACSLEERREVERLAAAALLTLDGDLAGDYFPLPGSLSYAGKPEGTSESDVEQLRSAGYMFERSNSATVRSSGMDREWPDARGVFCAPTPQAGIGQGALLVWVNEEDHLRLMALERSPDLRAAFDKFARAANGIEHALRDQGFGYVRSDELGYLLSCPSNLGTGLRVSVSTSLPKLSKIPRFKEAVQMLRLHCKPAGRAGVFDLSNQERLGKTEVELVNTVIEGVDALVLLEARLDAGEATVLIKEELARLSRTDEPEPQMESMELPEHPGQPGAEQPGLGHVESLLVSPG